MSTLSATQAADLVHAELWGRFIDTHGLIRDYVGETPTPEDCRLGRPNAIGWWSPIENGPMFTGLYLPAMCERARRSGDVSDAKDAGKLAWGLVTCASVSDVSGFIVRGVGTDGTCHYPMGSDDQTHPWFLGLHAYVKSGIPVDGERAAIVAKMVEVADVLESTSWRCPCDGAFKGQFRGRFTGRLFRDAVRYLHLLRTMHDVTGDPVWLDRYLGALAEKPRGSDKTRVEICGGGYPADRDVIANIDAHALWIYVGCQWALVELIAMDTDEAHLRHYRAGLAINADHARSAIDAYQVFDNNDDKVFGNANWREGYPTWFPQTTQADALRQAKTGDREKLGARKGYECRYMRNPLAGAVIIALAGNPAHRALVEQVICHYDYAKINMAELFFAECAYYALPGRLSE